MPTAFRPDPARTRLLAERWSSWVLPHWLERQADPTSPAFHPAPDVGGVENRTLTDRVPIGVLDAPVAASVDPRGLVTPGEGRWSLDWWVGADDRWHIPSREVAVRQRCVDGTPVVETTMRVPGGDVVHRTWAFQDADLGDVVAVEIENASRVPVALALAVRPYGPDGAGTIGSIEVHRSHVSVDGRVAMWLPREPARVAAASFADGDVADTVLSGAAAAGAEVAVTCAAGLASAAIVVPLAHTASLQVLMPLRPDATADRPSTAVPPADATARGWRSHIQRSVRIDVPNPEWSDLLSAASARLLLESADLALTGEVPTVDVAAVVGALDRLGLHAEAAAVVATLPVGQGTGGRLGGGDPSDDATAAALLAAGRHWRVTRDDQLTSELAGQLAAGAHYRAAGGLRGRLRRSAPDPVAPLALGRRVRALTDVAHALDGTRQHDAAGEVRRLIAEAREDLAEAVAASTSGRLDPSAVDLLGLVGTLGVVDPSTAAVDQLVAYARQQLDVDGGVARLVGASGLSPADTAALGRIELRRGERSALDRLSWLARTAGPSLTLSDLVHPRLLAGCSGGASPVVAAALVELILDVLVVEDDSANALVLCPVWPVEWLGAGVEVHDLPTVFGRLSYAIRWHGERPALLWEIEPHDPDGAVTVTAPGLDPTWSSTEVRGDALLAAPVIPAEDDDVEAATEIVTPVAAPRPPQPGSFS